MKGFDLEPIEGSPGVFWLPESLSLKGIDEPLRLRWKLGQRLLDFILRRPAKYTSIRRFSAEMEERISYISGINSVARGDPK